ncbi:GntR family transcriptional regulator [Actinomycetes bacterium KLBMP 9759]
MSRPLARSDPPYVQIATQIRGRIVDGDLRPGDRVPSTRRIAAQWHVAMATATKVLARLQEDGLVHVVPGAGTVVSPRPTDRPEPAAGQVRNQVPAPQLDAERVVATAVRIADADGLAAVTMRRIGVALGIGAMSIYRYLPDKAELVRRMADAVLAEHPLPEPAPAGWRERLTVVARLHWGVYRSHPWAAGPLLASMSHPRLVPSGMAHVEWELAGMAGLGLDHLTMLRTVFGLHCYVGGMAMGSGHAQESERATGVSAEQQQAADLKGLPDLLTAEQFPLLTGLDVTEDGLADLDGHFEFGLQRHLDGLETFVAAHSSGVCTQP